MRGASAAPAVDTGAEVDAVLVPPLVEGLAEAPEAVAVVSEAVLDAVPALLVSDALLVSVAVVSVLVADFVPVVLVRVLAIHQHCASNTSTPDSPERSSAHNPRHQAHNDVPVAAIDGADDAPRPAERHAVVGVGAHDGGLVAAARDVGEAGGDGAPDGPAHGAQAVVVARRGDVVGADGGEGGGEAALAGGGDGGREDGGGGGGGGLCEGGGEAEGEGEDGGEEHGGGGDGFDNVVMGVQRLGEGSWNLSCVMDRWIDGSPSGLGALIPLLRKSVNTARQKKCADPGPRVRSSVRSLAGTCATQQRPSTGHLHARQPQRCQNPGTRRPAPRVHVTLVGNLDGGLRVAMLPLLVLCGVGRANDPVTPRSGTRRS